MPLLAVVVLGGPLLHAPPAGADEAESMPLASRREARDAIKAFGKASRADDPRARADAVRALGECLHPSVADRLLRFAKREDPGEGLVAAYETLGRLRPFAEQIAPKLADVLGREADAAADRLAKGDGGFRIDPRTGDADTTSEEGRARLAEARARAASNVALLGALDALGWEPEKKVPDLTPFLQDASDELVVATLRRLAAWDAFYALPAVLDLYRMYPTVASWETGEVVDLGGTNATAKAKWMVIFGHPRKQRPRPAVVQELRTMLEAVTGRSFEDPESLARYLQRDEVETRIRRDRRRR